MITSNNKGMFVSNNQTYSNYTPSQQEIDASAKLTQQLLASNAAKKAASAASGCPKRPLFAGKKRDAYNKCMADVAAKKNAPAPIYIPAPTVVNPHGKMLGGMPQPLAIGLIVVTISAVIFGALKLINPKGGNGTSNLQLN